MSSEPTADPIENLLYPSGKTVLMQQLQTLVLRGNNYWVGGVSHPDKILGLAYKFAKVYPLTRDERGRVYDRSLGKAGVHFLFYPTERGVVWWLLSGPGKGGLDARSKEPGPDAIQAGNARAKGGHISFEDYVLLFAHKRDARTIQDARTGKEKQVIKDASTWTWKLLDRAYGEVVALIRSEAFALNYGNEPIAGKPADGLRGALYYQRQRPLFGGVRAQVLQCHREARDAWTPRRKRWLQIHTRFAEQYGDRAGQLMTLAELTKKHLPKMRRFRVFGDPTRTLSSLVRSQAAPMLAPQVAQAEETAAQ